MAGARPMTPVAISWWILSTGRWRFNVSWNRRASPHCRRPIRYGPRPSTINHSTSAANRSMALFRLLHASDLHLGRGGFTSLIAKAGWSHRLQNGWPLISHNPSAVGAFARFAFANRHSFDALVITGDLATTGNAWDLRAAYRLCSAAPAHQGVYLTSAG